MLTNMIGPKNTQSRDVRVCIHKAFLNVFTKLPKIIRFKS